jgi:hypothetical protein
MVSLLLLILVFFKTAFWPSSGEGVLTMLMSFLFFSNPCLGFLSALKGISGLSLIDMEWSSTDWYLLHVRAKLIFFLVVGNRGSEFVSSGFVFFSLSPDLEAAFLKKTGRGSVGVDFIVGGAKPERPFVGRLSSWAAFFFFFTAFVSPMFESLINREEAETN